MIFIEIWLVTETTVEQLVSEALVESSRYKQVLSTMQS